MLEKEEHRNRQHKPKSPSPPPKRKMPVSSATEHNDEEGQRKRPGSPPTGRNEKSDTEDFSSSEDGSNRRKKTKEHGLEKSGPLDPTPGTSSDAFYQEVLVNPEETIPERQIYDIQTSGRCDRADTGTPEPWDYDEGPDENMTPKAHQPSYNATSPPGVPSPLQSESVPKAHHRSRPNTEGVNHMLTEKRAPAGETRLTKDLVKARKVLVSSESLPQDVRAPVPESIASLHNRERTMGPLARAGSSRQHIEDHASTSLRLMNLHKQMDLLSGNLETLKIEVGIG